MGKIGGARVGAGRKPGSVNARSAEVIASALAEGKSPLEYMLDVMRDDEADPARRAWAAEKSAPYLHPRPAPMERKVDFAVPDTSTPDGVGRALDAILQAVGRGELSPGEAQSIVAIVEARRRAIETGDLAERVAKLEQALPTGMRAG